MSDESSGRRAGVAPRRPLFWLVTGTLAGVVLAAAGLVKVETAATPAVGDVVARVNGRPIRIDDYNRVVAALDRDRRGGVTPDERRRVLDRLIEEELLIQRALELGLADHDVRVRKDLTVAMVDAIVAPTAALNPDEDELRAFFEEIKGSLTQSERLRVRQVWVRVQTLVEASAAHQRAAQAVARLRRGEEFAAVKAALGDQEVVPLPESLLPAAKLVDYLGPTAVRAVARLEIGAVTDPVRSSSGYHVLQLLERRAGEPPEYEAVRPQVLAEYRRRAADRALRSYLDDLRSRSDIEVFALED